MINIEDIVKNIQGVNMKAKDSLQVTIPINLLGKIQNGGVHRLEIYEEPNVSPDEWPKLGAALMANASIKDPSETLTLLNFHDTNFGVQGMSYIAKYLCSVSQIEKLNLANTQITPMVMTDLVRGIDNQKNLTHLSLAGNDLDDASMISLLDVLKDKPIVELNLSHVNMSAGAAMALADFLSTNQTIEVLYLHNNKLTSGLSRLAQGLAANKSLTQLDLGHCALTPQDVMALARVCKEQNRLKQLSLNGNTLAECANQLFDLWNDPSMGQPLTLEALLLDATELPDVHGLCQFIAQNQSLKTLSLNGNALQAAHTAQLQKAVQQCESLQRLFLRQMDINHEHRDAVLRFVTDTPHLRHLDLSENPMSSELHLQLSKALADNQSLVVLDLVDTLVGDMLAHQYAASLKTNSELKSLNLSANGISVEGLRDLSLALRHNYRLEALTLDKNPWQKRYVDIQEDPRHMIDNLCERLVRTIDDNDTEALNFIKKLMDYKAIDDFDEVKHFIPKPTTNQQMMLDNIELALLVREMFRNCHDNQDLNQIIDHSKPEQGVMQLVSLMAQRQNIAEQHFVALAEKIEKVKAQYKLQEVMESITPEELLPGFKDAMMQQGVADSLEQMVKHSEQANSDLGDVSPTFTPSFDATSDDDTPMVTLEVTDEERAVIEKAMQDILAKKGKPK